MNRDDIIARLKDAQADLHKLGVRHVALFGSRARGDALPDSDTDLMIDIDPDMELSVFEYVRLKRTIADLFDGPVDVVDRAALKEALGPPAEREAVYAF